MQALLLINFNLRYRVKIIKIQKKSNDRIDIPFKDILHHKIDATQVFSFNGDCYCYERFFCIIALENTPKPTLSNLIKS